MKAKLVQNIGRQRFYELSEYINKGRNLRGDVDISASLRTLLETHILPEYKEQLQTVLSDERGTKWVCVSDAITHIERLVIDGTTILCLVIVVRAQLLASLQDDGVGVQDIDEL